MKKSTAKVLSYFLLTAAGIAAGWGGGYAVQLFTQPDDMAAVEVVSVQPQPDTDAVQLRVRGGQMEWFDGVRWNTAAAVDDLKQNDAAGAQSDAWRALAQQRADAKETQRQESLARFDHAQMDLTVGEKPAAQTTPAKKPGTSTSATTPATGGTTTPPPAQPQPPTGGGNTGGSSSNSGDGWSDDYL